MGDMPDQGDILFHGRAKLDRLSSISTGMLLMRILKPSLAIVLGLALAPAAALAQASNVSVPPPNPKASVTTTNPVTSSGQGANNSQPVGGPSIDKTAHAKNHKRAHHKMYGKHHDYTKSSPAKGPTAPHLKTTGTN
jgi:hypothetical protein